MAALSCPWCQAPRGDGPDCPKCGANYAKAEAIRKHGRAPAAAAAAPAAAPAPAADEGPVEILRPGAKPAPVRPPVLLPEVEQVMARTGPDSLAGMPPVEDPKLEFWFCVAAIPGMLLLGILFNAFLPSLQRIFLGMPVHELGHAVASWLTGYVAIPTVWKTLTFEQSRLVPMFFVMLALAGWLVWKGRRDESRLLVGLGIGLAVLQLWWSLLLSAKTAKMIIVFGGDAGGMVLGTALMMTFFFGKETNLYKGSLRWGFVAIGAAAYVDMFGTWLAARRDHARIPFGEMEGAGHSDATRLVDDFGWTIDQLISRHLTVGVLCLLALAAVYAWGVWRAWQHWQERS